MGLRGATATFALLIALATGGLATAGVVSLPDLPDAASDRAEAVHDALERGDRPGPASQASDAAKARVERKADRSERGAQRGGQGTVTTQNSHNDFGDTVSDRATAGEPKEDGRAFGESVSGEAKQHAPALPPQAQNAPENGEARSEQGGENGQAFSEQRQETGEAMSEQGRQTGDTASGGRVP